MLRWLPVSMESLWKYKKKKLVFLLIRSPDQTRRREKRQNSGQIVLQQATRWEDIWRERETTGTAQPPRKSLIKFQRQQKLLPTPSCLFVCVVSVSSCRLASPGNVVNKMWMCRAYIGLALAIWPFLFSQKQEILYIKIECVSHLTVFLLLLLLFYPLHVMCVGLSHLMLAVCACPSGRRKCRRLGSFSPRRLKKGS